jgi:hypothetical protein
MIEFDTQNLGSVARILSILEVTSKYTATDYDLVARTIVRKTLVDGYPTSVRILKAAFTGTL